MKTELNCEPVSAAGFRFCIVVSRWNDELTSRLVDGAIGALISAGADETAFAVLRVPGAFELPVACLKAAKTGEYDAIIALGVVVRGETPHFEYVAGQAAAGILQASMQSGVPVMFGVVTADTMDQAHARCGERADNKGYEAALSAVEMVNLFREMDAAQGKGKVFPHVA